MLFQQLEHEETDAVREMRRVEEVRDARKQMLSNLKEQAQNIRQALKEARQNERVAAARSSSYQKVSSITRYEQRLERELERLLKKVEKKKAEFELAEKRLCSVRDDLKEAQVEKKKVEHLLATAAQARQTIKAAREEDALDDLTSRRGSKGG